MTTNTVLTLLISAGVALGGLFLVPYLKVQMAKLTEARRTQIIQFADMAFGVIEELAAKTETDIDDKAAAGLRQLEKMLLENGHPGMTDGEKTLAQARFDGLHAATRVATSPS